MACCSLSHLWDIKRPLSAFLHFPFYSLIGLQLLPGEILIKQVCLHSLPRGLRLHWLFMLSLPSAHSILPGCWLPKPALNLYISALCISFCIFNIMAGFSFAFLDCSFISCINLLLRCLPRR